MSMSDACIEIFNTAERTAKARLLTKGDLAKILHNLLRGGKCPLTAIRFRIVCPEPFREICIEYIPRGSANDRPCKSYVLRFNDNRNSKAYLDIWYERFSHRRYEILGLRLRKILRSYWKAQLRTLPAGMIDLKKSSKVITLSRNTLRFYVANRKGVTMLYCDLDNFKSINMEFGIREGDRVIREIGAILEYLTIDNAITLHNGGDEFVILTNNSDPKRASSIAEKIESHIRSHDFKLNSKEITVSVGVRVSNSKRIDFDKILQSSYDDMLKQKLIRRN